MALDRLIPFSKPARRRASPPTQRVFPIPQLLGPSCTGQDCVSLRLLATTDLHAHILPWDHHTDRPAEARGLARLASLIDHARGEKPQTLLLDNGDFLHGSALGDHWANDWAEATAPRRRHAHPMIAAMNRLGYDAATLGNHEFSRGIGFLRACLAEAEFPVVSANAQARRGGLVAPWVLLPRNLQDHSGQSHQITVGIIGFLPPLTTVWERSNLQGRLQVEDILAAARREVPRLRAAGADLVIALSHSGIESDLSGNSPGGERASRALAALPGIDAVIAGHTHELFPKPGSPAEIEGKPVVMPGFFGSHLGVIDLVLRQGGAGWQVVLHRASLRALDPGAIKAPPGAFSATPSPRAPSPPPPSPFVLTPPAPAPIHSRPDLVALAVTDHLTLQRRNAEVIGKTSVPLSTHFALVAPSDALALIASAMARHLRAALAGGGAAALPLLAAVAPFKCGGRGGPENYTHIAPGPLTLRHIDDLYMHPNTLTGLRLSGAEVVLWLERAVSLYHQIAPGAQDSPLINPAFPSFNFDMIHGLRYTIDLSQPPRFDANGAQINPTARRIRDLRLADGCPLGPRDWVILATHNYRSHGGAGFAGTGAGARVVLAPRLRVRDLLAHDIRRGAPIDLHADWSFAPVTGASAAFLAPRSLPDQMPPKVSAMGAGLEAEGFKRFRLTL